MIRFMTVAVLALLAGGMVSGCCSGGRCPFASERQTLQKEDGLFQKEWVLQLETLNLPENTEKPGAQVREEVEVTPFLKKLRYQQERNNHFGIYEYLQLNAAYSSNRMASNRLKRQQVESIYRTNRIDPGFEPVKVDDILEVLNHLGAMDFVIRTALEPLTSDYVKKLHYLLTYGTYADRKQYFGSSTFRTKPPRLYKDTAADPREIARKLNKLVMDYEKESADLEKILEFHVRFEQIRPFADYNGRVGRLILIKECLRYGVDPFILDDKRRTAYYRGIARWDDDSSVLMETVLQAQARFQTQMETCMLMEYCRPANPRKL